MAKGGKRHKEFGNPNKKRARHEHFGEQDMDDEVDAFHKQRDIIALDVDDDVDASDEDNEHPVFDIEKSDDEEDEEVEEEEDDDDERDTGLAAQIKRTQKYIRGKYPGVDEDMDDDEEEEEEETKVPWGGKKRNYYENEVQSDDEEILKEEEEEVVRLQREKAKSITLDDYDVLQGGSDSDEEPTLEDILTKGKGTSKSHVDKDTEDETGTTYAVDRDLNALSKEEQMDVVYSSAPELVGLLSELSDAVEQLEGRVNPLLDKVKGNKSSVRGGMHYLEVEKVLLLAYCQSISFYLLLKSEGHPVRDHPVIARLVEIKTMLDKMKQLDGNLPSEIEEILNLNQKPESITEILKESDAVASQPLSACDLFSNSAKTDGAVLARQTTTALVKVDEHKTEQVKRKKQTEQVGLQSMEMLKLRASLEEKLKKKGSMISSALQPDKAKKHFVRPLNRQLESLGDFDDEVVDKEGVVRGLSNGHASALQPNKLSQLVTSRVKKLKIVAGDDDLPPRDDVGERRRKFELRVLAKAGVDNMDDDAALATEDSRSRRPAPKDFDVEEDDEPEESEDEVYKQAKERKAAKLAAKAQIYTRTSGAPSLAETELVDGKRQINYQMEKNRGLTRARKKSIKNPRVHSKLKHKKAVRNQKGQSRSVKRPSGPYGGEVSGINAGITHSTKFRR